MKCNWPLGNGQFLEFDVFAKNEGWKAVAGIYIFSYQLHDGKWQPVYVGQTDNFSLRMRSHDRLNEAIQAGATHIHAVVVNFQQNRDLLESMLIQHLQPQLNRHHRNRGLRMYIQP